MDSEGYPTQPISVRPPSLQPPQQPKPGTAAAPGPGEKPGKATRPPKLEQLAQRHLQQQKQQQKPQQKQLPTKLQLAQEQHKTLQLQQLQQLHLKQQQRPQHRQIQAPQAPQAQQIPQIPQAPQTQPSHSLQPNQQDVAANQKWNAEAVAQNRRRNPAASHPPRLDPDRSESSFHKPRRKQAQKPLRPFVHPLQLRVSDRYRIASLVRPDSLYRSLNEPPKSRDMKGKGKRKGRAKGRIEDTKPFPPPASPTNPRRVASNAAAANKAAAAAAAAVTATTTATTVDTRPALPLCSNRARAASGGLIWACDVVQKAADPTAVAAARGGAEATGPTSSASPSKTASKTASTDTGGGASSPAAASSPTGTATITPTIGSNGNSLRASIFKKSSALLYGNAGGASSTAGQRDTDGTDKDAKLKPWRPELPRGTPYYFIPPPSRRFGGLAKASSRAYNLSKASAGGAAMARSSAGGSQAGSSVPRSRNSSSNSALRNNNTVTMKTGSGNGATSSGRIHKSPAVRYADFYPWKGRRPEDRFTEATIRAGYSDRLQNSAMQAAEKSSARSWLPLILRQKHTAPMLGQALALANALSREKNYIVPASQFKLPPRVTVTDTRRETWLRDLTNPGIPLRKLSRTIPHGLRGKILLEQCVLKAVPVDRAMWLARCVGAQELRAFKRKGTVTIVTLAESEIRWLKDWTLMVQLFLEGFLVELNLSTSTGQDRLQYAARFTRQLFLERLLEHDQFLAWMLEGLRRAARIPAAAEASSSSLSVPYFDVWLCLVEEYISSIMERRNAASHLAVTVLCRLDFLSQCGVSSTHCKKLLQTMAHARPETFVCQAVWPRYEQQLIRSLLPTPASSKAAAPTHLHASLDAIWTIRHRNDSLRPENMTEMDQALTMLRPLDEALLRPVAFASHFAAFLRLDKRKTIPFVIRWCASLHRPGLAKVYITARLLHVLCKGDAALVTSYLLSFLSSSRHRGSESTSTQGSRMTSEAQPSLHYLHDQQPEGSKAFYLLVGILARRKLFLPPHYLSSLILQSRPSDGAEIGPSGLPQIRLAAELPVHLLDRSTVNLRANHLRRLGYDTDFETQDVASILREVQSFLALHEIVQTETAVAGSPTSAVTDPTAADVPSSSEALSALAQRIEDRSRNVKMAVADYLAKHVVVPLRAYRPAVKNTASAAPAARHVSFLLPKTARDPRPTPGSAINPALMSLEKANAIRALIEKTDDFRLLAEFVMVLARAPQTFGVMALCADTVHLHLTAFAAMDFARVLYDVVLRRALAITVGIDAAATTAFQTLLPAGTDLRPLVLALPALAEKMPPPGPGSLVLWANMRPVRLVPAMSLRKGRAKAPAPAGSARGGDRKGTADGLARHFDGGPAMASEIRARLVEMDQRLSTATYDADCSPLSDGRGPEHARHEDTAADEVRDEMVKISSSGCAIDSTTMDRLFGTIAMFSQERWRRLQPGTEMRPVQARARDDLRLSASLFARLRRINPSHFDTIMVKWLKRLRIVRDRPAIGTLYPVFVVFGCLDLQGLLATTADEQPREPDGVAQSPARNTWRTSYLQDVLSLLAVPMTEHHPVLRCDECLRFRLFQNEAPFTAPAGVSALVRNAVAEMTLWRHNQRQVQLQLQWQQKQQQQQQQHAQTQLQAQQQRLAMARRPIDALAVSRLLRVAALADAPAAAQALSKTTDPTVRSGLWEMMTLALTRKVRPSRAPLDMLRGLDVFAADVGQLALGLVVAPGPYASAADCAKEADSLSSLVLGAVSGFRFAHLRILRSLPADLAAGLKSHAQSRFLALLPTRGRQQPVTDGGDVGLGLGLGSSMKTERSSSEAWSSDTGDFRMASGLLDVVRTVMLDQQQQTQNKLVQYHKQERQRQQKQAAAKATSVKAEDAADTEVMLQPPPPPVSPGAALPVVEAPVLEASIVEKLVEMWYLLREPSQAKRGSDEVQHVRRLKRAILQDWLPAVLSLILLHLPNYDALAMGRGGSYAAKREFLLSQGRPRQPSSSDDTIGSGTGLGREQEAVHAGACVALASLWRTMASLADEPDSDDGGDENDKKGGHMALQNRVYDTALLLADGLSNETRQHCLRVLREAAAAAAAAVTAVGGAMGAAGDLPPALAYMLSSPVSGTIYYPQLYLERLPSMQVFSRVAKGKAGHGARGGSEGPPVPVAVAPAPLKRIAASMGFGGLLGNDRNRRVRFGLKTWDAVSDPSPAVQDNDTAVNLWLLEATKVVRPRKR